MKRGELVVSQKLNFWKTERLRRISWFLLDVRMYRYVKLQSQGEIGAGSFSKAREYFSFLLPPALGPFAVPSSFFFPLCFVFPFLAKSQEWPQILSFCPSYLPFGISWSSPLLTVPFASSGWLIALPVLSTLSPLKEKTILARFSKGGKANYIFLMTPSFLNFLGSHQKTSFISGASCIMARVWW